MDLVLGEWSLPAIKSFPETECANIMTHVTQMMAFADGVYSGEVVDDEPHGYG
jgi:hypothetical protein